MVGQSSTSSVSQLSKSYRFPCLASPLRAHFQVWAWAPSFHTVVSLSSDVWDAFNAIICRLALYQFMVIAHYGYLVLKMSSSNGIVKICRDCPTDVSALEKLHALAAAQEVAAGYGPLD
jgi:hypothetical protein